MQKGVNRGYLDNFPQNPVISLRDLVSTLVFSSSMRFSEGILIIFRLILDSLGLATLVSEKRLGRLLYEFLSGEFYRGHSQPYEAGD